MPYHSADQKNSSAIYNCHKCQSKITEVQHCVECDNCHKYFHLRCEGVVGQHIARSMDEWFCKSCKTASSNDSNKRTIADTSPEDLHSSKKRQNLLQSPANNDDSKLDKILICLNNLQSSQNDLANTVKIVKENQEFISLQFDVINKKLNEVEIEQKRMKKDMSSVQNIQDDHSNIIYSLEAEVDSFKQMELENNVIIGGLPKNFDENIVVQNIMSTLKTNCSMNDVESVIKLNNKQNNLHATVQESDKISPYLLVKFKSKEAKMELVKKKIEKKSLFTNEIGLNTSSDRQIFIRDHITSYKMNLFNECKKIKTQFQFKYLWMSGSKILMRKLEKSKVHSINSRNDVNKLLFFLSQTQNQATTSSSSSNEATQLQTI